MAWRNERVLYKRSCDLCQKSIVSIYPAGTPWPVYCITCWRSDTWNPLDNGRDFDFARPFFDQWQEVLYATPMPALLQSNCENSDYAHAAGNNKNVYLVFCSSFNENCYYSYWLQKSRDCLDCSHCNECEQCYECEECFKCYNLRYSQNSSDCVDSAFLYDCRGCQNCFMSVGLRNKSYCIKNVQYSREEYEQRMREFNLGSAAAVTTLARDFETFKLGFPRRFQHAKNSEDCSGDYFLNSKNCFQSFTAKFSENCAYSHDVLHLKDSMDVSLFGNTGEWLYEVNNVGLNSSNVKFSSYGYGLSFADYTYQCHNSTELFGCVSLHGRNSYCILNKQYSAQEYKALRARIIEHMRASGEYGEFPPVALALSAYNETQAAEYFPLEKAAVTARGWKWSDSLPFTTGKETMSWTDVADDVREVDDSLCGQVLACQVTGKNFKITKPELELYKKLGVPVPRLHPDARHARRMMLRNPNQLWQRQCMCTLAGHDNHAEAAPCRNQFATSYAPERTEKIFCETCYEKTIA
ncbi:MAG: hypothetical protein A3F54_03320 [Candidatus Kerfeldbacteria bacterium RIFCSPHIGHO2_12_FULL_48_17]|uniref:Uncharacterized protein n=1 Tax=Candidatus Kerfeldbacteria bacterium RIFCSPHIGHO2_12_FULL_48_17 TaxID=1798542 RepID=A0A1G2B7V7_9BACT|nr:MAG: hypothetical protein A3F54_03320 [Candidatus Kerfeldbacteria bacterium RIFCSPHIGHO2_12_FULL_48_17]